MQIVPDCLGMEFELSAPEIRLNLTDTHTEEKDIKGIDILGDEDMYLKLTLDPRTTFHGNKDKQNMALEFILNHTECSIDSMDFTKMGQYIQSYITSHSSKFYILSNIIPGSCFVIPSNKNVCPATIYPEKIDTGKRTVMVHVTCACPLESIGKSALGMERIAMPSKCSDEVRGFLFLVDELWAGAGGDDAKQKMLIMNRTSFGAIFNLFSLYDKELIMDSLLAMDRNTGKICPDCTVSQFYTYLNELKDKRQTVEDDPTYKANENMFLGISALGDTFVQKGTKYWPIFEFRRSGNPSISYVSQYFENIKKELDARMCYAPDFQKHERS